MLPTHTFPHGKISHFQIYSTTISWLAHGSLAIVLKVDHRNCVPALAKASVMDPVWSTQCTRMVGI